MMSRSLPISETYRQPLYNAIGIQVFFGLVSLLILDGGTMARICGVSILAFWGATVVMIWRRPQTPTSTDLFFLKFGFFAVAVAAYFVVPAIWHARGVD